MARVNLNKPLVLLTAQRLTTSLVARTGSKILRGAKHLAPRGTHISGSGKPKADPTLQASLFERTTVTATTVRSVVGSRNSYAASVALGSKPHLIVSRRGKRLKFQWDRARFATGRGGFVYLRKVRHPGNKRPSGYLTTPLVMFGRAAGFKVSTVTRPSGPLP